MTNSISDGAAGGKAVREAIFAKGMEWGLDALGIANPDSIHRSASHLSDFLDSGYHGDMDWMGRRHKQRADPVKLWPDVRSIIVAGHNYGPAGDPLVNISDADIGNISVYARGRDYHDVLKKRLKRLARWTVAEFGCEAKVFVDTAPVMEKPLAQAAGLGWQGKHTNLVSRDYGSWLFLGAIFTDMDLPPTGDHRDRCGDCHACLDICPTGAFPVPYRLDARRCISYLTIEHKGHIPLEFRKPIGNRIYGCDDCLAVCPWNKFAQTAREVKYHARESLKAPAIADFLAIDDANFRAFFSGSPIKRTGRDRFIRNALIAAGNSRSRTLLAPVRKLLDDASPLVRAMAVWALGQLAGPDEITPLKAQAKAESDPDVKAEWARL